MSDELAVWRFTPVADPQDGAWQGRPIWKELTIVASSAGAAMLEADRHFDRVKGVSKAVSNYQQQVRSGFADEKLYRVDRIDRPTTSPSGAVLSEVMF